jgi:FtsP/CotA-like multicopper oxidase with cupredoxin domain
LVLTRGQPTSIEVVNRTPEPTAVHWHGIELESYYDGAVGWSGQPGKTAPAIPPGGRFEVHITPKRAGTFMYHTHFDEMRQQYGGLVGPLIVTESGESWNPTRDFVFVISDGRRGSVVINGADTPPTKDLVAGRTYRLRIADIAIYRQNLRAQVRRDSALVEWRPVAKDGFTLPANQAVVRRAVAQVASGETADFELTPDRAGEYILEIGVPAGATGIQVQGAVRLHVSDR